MIQFFTLIPGLPYTNAAVNALTDDSTLNAVLSLTKKFDEQVRLNEQCFQEQEDKINLLSNSSQRFSLGRGRWPRSSGSFRSSGVVGVKLLGRQPD